MNIRNLTQRAGDAWQNLSSSQRRIVIFATIILVVALIFNFTSPDKQPREKKAAKPAFSFSQPDMAAEVMAEKLQTSIQSQKAQLQVLQQRLDQVEHSARRENAIRPAGKNPAKDTGEDAMLREMNKAIGSSEILPAGETPYAPAPVLRLPEGNIQGEVPADVSRPSPGESPGTASKAQPQPKNAGEPLPPPRSLGVLSCGDACKKTDKPKDAEKTSANGFYVPSPGFFEVSLLTGLDAPTGNKAKNQPSPLALRVQDLAWLPNEIRQDLKGCFILAEGIGELSTERVNVRGISISCIASDGRQVLDQKLLGFVADSDGKAGMRGEVVSKAGKLLAETMKVGFLQGLSEFFQFNARTLTVTDSGAISTPKSSDMGNALLGGASSGVGKALDKVASYYMSLAEEVFPVIQVGATRSATFVVTQGTELVFDKSLTRGKKDNPNDL